MEIRRVSTDDELPVPLDDLKLDLRVDDDDEDETLERAERTAASLIEKRSGVILIPGTFEALFDACDNPIRVERAPLREVTGVAAMTGRNEWTDLDLDDFRVLELESAFELRPFPGYVAPAFYIPDLSFRVRFTAGFREPASGESDGEALPMPDLFRGALIAITGGLYANRELGEFDATMKVGEEMAGLLQSIRKFW